MSYLVSCIILKGFRFDGRRVGWTSISGFSRFSGFNRLCVTGFNSSDTRTPGHP